MFKRITIIGDGGMATACAIILCSKDLNVTMWGHDAEQLGEIQAAGENIHFLPGYKLPAELKYNGDDTTAMQGAELLVSAVPCQFMRGVWRRLKKHVPALVPIVSVTKGIENRTLMRPTEILEELLGPERGYAALSGPTIADELVQCKPATITAACPDDELAREVQETFSTDWFRVYTNPDLPGVELCGAVKNVIAIAAGIIDGMKLGDNAKAALLSRGLAEITRLGRKLGADEHTFAGLSGLGDLVTTCISPHGRNRSFGQRIGEGTNAKDAVAATKSVVEGVATCESVRELAHKHDVEMPITEEIHAVIAEGKSVRQAVHDLMTRTLKAE